MSFTQTFWSICFISVSGLTLNFTIEDLVLFIALLSVIAPVTK